MTVSLSKNVWLLFYSNVKLFAVIIRGLEEQLFVVTKEKENLEDDLQMKLKQVRNCYLKLTLAS